MLKLHQGGEEESRLFKCGVGVQASLSQAESLECLLSPFQRTREQPIARTLGILIERHSTKDVVVFSSFMCLPMLLLVLNLFLPVLEVIESMTLAFGGKPAVGLGEVDTSMRRRHTD